MHSNDPAISTETVGDLPVIEATVLKGMDAELPQAKPDIDILEVEYPGVERCLINSFGYICRKDVTRPRTEGRVVVVRVDISGHVPLATDIPDRASVDNVPSEISPPRFGVGLEQLVDQVVHVDKDVTVGLHHVLGFGTEGGHPLQPHDRFQREVVVGVGKVLHHDVVEDLALLLHHLVQDMVGVPPQQEQGDQLDALEVVLVSPGLPDRLPGIKLLVRGADQDDEERVDGLAFVGLVDKVVEVVWVQGTGSDVGEVEVLLLGDHARKHTVSHDGRRGSGGTQVPERTGPANHG